MKLLLIFCTLFFFKVWANEWTDPTTTNEPQINEPNTNEPAINEPEANVPETNESEMNISTTNEMEEYSSPANVEEPNEVEVREIEQN
jgi:hypothetical protein